MNGDGESPLLSERADVRLVGVRRLSPPSVVDMEDVERAWGDDPAPVLGEQDKECGRVEPPRYGQVHRGAARAPQRETVPQRRDGAELRHEFADEATTDRPRTRVTLLSRDGGTTFNGG